MPARCAGVAGRIAAGRRICAVLCYNLAGAPTLHTRTRCGSPRPQDCTARAVEPRTSAVQLVARQLATSRKIKPSVPYRAEIASTSLARVAALRARRSGAFSSKNWCARCAASPAATGRDCAPHQPTMTGTRSPPPLSPTARPPAPRAPHGAAQSPPLFARAGQLHARRRRAAAAGAAGGRRTARARAVRRPPAAQRRGGGSRWHRARQIAPSAL